MVDASERRAVNGVTPGIYDLLRPWVCALPVNDLPPININTMLPGQAPLLAMLLPGQLRVEQARQMLIRRPANGFSSVAAFWAMLARTGLSPLSEGGPPVKNGSTSGGGSVGQYGTSRVVGLTFKKKSI